MQTDLWVLGLNGAVFYAILDGFALAGIARDWPCREGWGVSVYLKDAQYDRFYKGLMVALRAQGEEYVSTFQNEHHTRFARVAHVYKERRKLGGGCFNDFPAFFQKSAISSQYRGLEEALLYLQHGVLGAQNPFYSSVKFGCTAEQAARVLVEEFSDSEQVLLRELALVFSEKEQCECELLAA
jgi:hypothetical protein